MSRTATEIAVSSNYSGSGPQYDARFVARHRSFDVVKTENGYVANGGYYRRNTDDVLVGKKVKKKKYLSTERRTFSFESLDALQKWIKSYLTLPPKELVD